MARGIDRSIPIFEMLEAHRTMGTGNVERWRHEVPSQVRGLSGA